MYLCIPFWWKLKNEGYFLKRISKSHFCNSKGLFVALGNFSFSILYPGGWRWPSFPFLVKRRPEVHTGSQALPGLEGHWKSKDVHLRELCTLVIPGFSSPEVLVGWWKSKEHSISWRHRLVTFPAAQLSFAAWVPLGRQCLCVITQYWCTSVGTNR